MKGLRVDLAAFELAVKYLMEYTQPQSRFLFQLIGQHQNV